jgi:hypothetical protein
MDSTDVKKPQAEAGKPVAKGPLSAELHNDRSHDSTVDTDGKNLEAARIAGHSAIGPDEVTTSDASLDNSVPEALDGFAGFDSRIGGNHLLLALQPGYTVIDKGMVAPEKLDDVANIPSENRSYGNRHDRGRMHYALNHLRPARVIELQRGK